MKRTLLLVLVFLLIFSLVACRTSETSAPIENEVIKLKFGVAVNKDHIYNYFMEKFIEVVEEKSGGTIQVDTYFDGLLGDERQLIEGCQVGAVDLTITNNAVMAGFVPETQIYSLPMIYEDTDHQLRVVNSDIHRILDPEFTAANLKVFGFLISDGWRGVINGKHPIKKLDDCKGVKIRLMESQLMLDVYSALGFEAVTMSLGEVTTALQNKVVDGVEMPPSAINVYRFYDLVDYYTDVCILNFPLPITMSLKTWNSFTEEQQKWVEESVEEAREYTIGILLKMNEEALVELEENGAEIVYELEDRERWVEAIQPVFNKYAVDVNPEMLKQIEALKD